MTSQLLCFKNMVLVDYIWIFFYICQYVWPRTVHPFVLLAMKLLFISVKFDDMF